MTRTELHFDVGGGESITLDKFDLVVAGYTARDETAVMDHIRELAAIGVPEPESVPAFYGLTSTLATQESDVTVSGDFTSGEVEPVIIRAGGRLYLTVGSDHTDRDIERTSVRASKAACIKPLASTAVEITADMDWDSIVLSSRLDGRPYQQGTLATLRVPTQVLALLDEKYDPSSDVVMFGGTISLLDGTFVAGQLWDVSLTLAGGTTIEHSYRVTVDSGHTEEGSR